MTVIQQHAMEIIERLSDDKMYYVVNILESIEGLASETGSEELTKSQKAYQNFQRFRKSGSVERDYKEELHKALEEKYESIS